MSKKPTSLKDLKKASQGSEKPGNITNRKIDAAIVNAKGSQIKGLAIGATLFSVLAIVGAFFYLFSQGMAVKIAPAEAKTSGYVTLKSGLGWVSDEGEVFVLGSNYRIGVHAKDFVTQLIDITPGTKKSFLEVTLKPEPATVRLSTSPEHDGTRWLLNDQLQPSNTSLELKLEPGEHKLVVNNPYFEPVAKTLTVKRAEKLELIIPLGSIQGQVSLESFPGDASAIIDGHTSVILPYSGLMAGGKHSIEIQAVGHIPISDQIEITNTQRMIKRNYRMRPMQSGLIVMTQPNNANITIDGRSIRRGSLTTVNANQDYNIKVSQAGYVSENRTIRVSPGQTENIAVKLQAAFGLATFASQPSGADLYINGQYKGKTPASAELQALKTHISFKRPGYRSSTTTITPTPSKPTKVNVTLLTELQARLKELPPLMTDSIGIELVRFKPDNKAFYIGAARGEPGQHANEILRQMQLTKYFYAGKHEVTVGQFRKFSPSSGGGQSNNMPVTGITWAQAAQFCNWLSQQEGLVPVYRLQGNQVTGIDVYADGYRLPSETEWEWLARKVKRPQLSPFTWGTKKTITSASGNLADEGAKGTVPTYIPRYKDGYVKLAPVGSFPAELSGLYDMSGNVREWVGDRYSLYVPAAGSIEVNSFGPVTGEGHVVKGSSYKTATLTGLRAASRQQAFAAADDIGFRVVRYVYGAEDK